MNWQHGLVSIAASDAPRSDVLREVARRTGATVQGLDGLHDRITLQLDDATLGTALQMLAGQESYALVESPPTRKGGHPRFALSLAPPGASVPRPDVMRNGPPVAVLVENPRTHRMEVQTGPIDAPYPSAIRPDAEPVSVQINAD